ncbi:hypothetical protein S7711_09002 [Stachybotrys chartarum IBT 7711]|uniref:Rhodopsin domain-containing protein n=1 Tax=Stachybotrys chartarum (strain CBS 109288 / IBT 7711) TaxID=1280523 RepID=A0A084AX71_STACB|nr:hypothetical protein S7711_09002 [Stachybotrys chartarum IBT 7711]KFA48280.1 hypothetical protein S40293_08808 [Stachybotrys chartarum IBT 40293]
MPWVLNATPEVDAQSQYPTIIAICAVLSVLTIFIVGARLKIRFKNRGLAADDYMAALAVVFAVTYSVLCIVQTRYGLGLPLVLRPPENLITYTRVNFAGRPIYQIGISFFKIALLLSYLSLLKGTDHKTYRLIVWITLGLVFAGHLGCSLSLLFACTPVERSWNPLMPGTCLPPGPSFTAYAIVTIISDLAVTLIPIPVLVKLNVPTSKKLGLLAIFTLGLFTTVCSIMRYTQIGRIQYGDGNSTMLILWGTIEFNVGNMVSSLPFLAPVIFKKARGYRYRSKPTSGGDYGGSNNRAPRASNYKMGRLSHHASVNGPGGDSDRTRTASEENILQPGAILKSVTYTVHVDDNVDGSSPRQSDVETTSR